MKEGLPSEVLTKEETGEQKEQPQTRAKPSDDTQTQKLPPEETTAEKEKADKEESSDKNKE